VQTFALVVAIAVVAFDFQNLLSWWRGRTVEPGDEKSHDFTIVVPLFGHPRYFEGRRALLRYQANTLVSCDVTPPVMREFANQLEAEGWRVFRTQLDTQNPASLVKAALPAVSTTYALRLDADTLVGDGLPAAIAAVADDGADLCSVKVAAANPVTVAAKLQALEYRMAMLCRHFRPWLTSGACFIAKTASLRAIFESHSEWTPGEDIETGRVAHALGMRVRHCDLEVETDVPETFHALARQRRLWWAGAFRHWIVNADRNLVQLPVFTLYTIAVIWASLYFRWWEMIDPSSIPSTLPMLFFVYLLVTVVSNVQVASWWMLVFPFYSFVQTFVFPLVGASYYVLLAVRRGRLGRYRFGYGRREWCPAAAAVVPRSTSPARMHLAWATCLLAGFAAGAAGGFPVPVLLCLAAAAASLVCANLVAGRSSLFRTAAATGTVACDAVLPLFLVGALALLVLSGLLALTL
jgi:hypothetical protein